MQFERTKLSDAWLIETRPAFDSRGYFARTFCVEEFGAHGLDTVFRQHSVSLSKKKGTVRGMHFQRAPHSETKLVRCLRGAMWDVIIDIRPDSPTYRRWQGFELSPSNGRQLYIPKGFAHGFQTLEDDTEVNYLISDMYTPAAAAGIRYDDPAFGVTWPLPVSDISDRDLSWPEFSAQPSAVS